MLGLIVTVIFGLIFAYFATQNTIHVSIRFLNYTIESLPLYAVMLSSLLVGLFLSGIIAFINNISSSLRLHGKESTIKDDKKQMTELTKMVHQLQIENTRLKERLGEGDSDNKSL